MANLYTSGLELPVSDLVDLTIAQIVQSPEMVITISRYSAGDVFIEDIAPPTVYVENDAPGDTHIRVFLAAGQLIVGEKIKISIEG